MNGCCDLSDRDENVAIAHTAEYSQTRLRGCGFRRLFCFTVNGWLVRPNSVMGGREGFLCQSINGLQPILHVSRTFRRRESYGPSRKSER